MNLDFNNIESSEIYTNRNWGANGADYNCNSIIKNIRDDIPGL